MSDDKYDDQDYFPKDEVLRPILRSIIPEAGEEVEGSAEPQSPSPASGVVCPDINILFDPHGHRPDLEFRIGERGEAVSAPALQESGINTDDEPPPAHASTARTDEMSVQQSGEEAIVDAAVTGAAPDGPPIPSTGSDRPVLEKREQSTDLATRTKVSRIDSAQSDGSRLPSSAKPLSAPPLKLETAQSHDERDQNGRLERLHSQSAGALRDGPPQHESTSPIAQSATTTLPSFQKTFGEVPMVGLAKLAEAAVREGTQQQQAYARHHSQSFGSVTSPMSPILSHHQQYPPHAHPSPAPYYTPNFTARSPTNTVGASTIGESPHPYGSPQLYAHTPHFSPFSQRRPSGAQDGLPPVPMLPSASSSGESHNGYAGSSTDGYSTANTTPIDQAQLPDGTPRPPAVATMLPLPAGMAPPPLHLLYGPYTCDEVGCTAAPFQTQYLLTSHKHVHSPSRPHYCPVEGCVRAAGGKGFKRKNEMIRHRLVHESPGYVCPFCTDREHKYPRPDNLQRHVKVHHSDKQSDDLRLRGVLEKRADGNGKARRRRTGAAGDG
nr:hypothetical protein B0A51_07388 [Rachicladosporium sp. CCFEE 5018]